MRWSNEDPMKGPRLIHFIMDSIQKDCLEGRGDPQQMGVTDQNPQGRNLAAVFGRFLAKGSPWRIHKNAWEERKLAFKLCTLKGHWCHSITHQSTPFFPFPSLPTSLQPRKGQNAGVKLVHEVEQARRETTSPSPTPSCHGVGQSRGMGGTTINFGVLLIYWVLNAISVLSLSLFVIQE